MKVAFQGDRGAFSEVMASKLFTDAFYVPCKTFKQVFDGVNSDSVDYGVIPVENSLTGRIGESTDLLIASSLNICREGMLSIIHCLITNKNVALKDLKQIYAHPEALTQCRKFLSELNCELVSWYDGAAAAGIVKKRTDAGLIASERVATLYGLNILKKGVQNSKENITRFLIVNKKTTSSTRHDKTSLVFSARHKPGSLLHALKPFDDKNINLTRLESMPLKDKPWEYLFLIDFEGHIDDLKVQNALKELKKHTASVKILGSYPLGKYYK